MAKKTLWILFAGLALIIGTYPIVYLFFAETLAQYGLMSTKGSDTLTNSLWKMGFYTHIFFGGVALFIGWGQFSAKIRVKNIKLHRQIGKVYVFAFLISALASIYIAFYATGEMIATFGFLSLGILWFYTTYRAYLYIRKKDITRHKKMMIYSYALCFAGVTLRLWLPTLTLLFNDFILAYRISAWMCWLPNLIIAYFIVKQINQPKRP